MLVSSAIQSRLVSIKEDVFASFVVVLVALPLSMGLALVAGYPFESAAAVGLISGVIGGVVVGLLSGCSLQVSGAANGAAVMAAVFIRDLGFEAFALVVVLSGLIQIAAGALRFGPVFRAVSPALIQGMLAGIGLLIFASQFHVMVDDTPPGVGREFSGVVNLWSLPAAIWKGVSMDAHRAAALLGMLTISVILLWPRIAPKRLAFLPAPLLGVGLATFAAWLFGADIKFVPAPDDLLAAISPPSPQSLLRLGEGGLWLAALSLAFVSGAESLLTATAVDTMQRRTPRTRYNRELVAQGAGNVLCGALGVLPISGVIVRSSANVAAGGRTRLSTILHGVWILLLITLAPDVLRLIPVASLAAVLVYAGLSLIKFGFLRFLWREDRIELGIYAATLVTVVATDILTGIAVGVGLAVAHLFYTFSHLHITIEESNGMAVIRLEGAATFIRLPTLAAAFEQLPHGARVHLKVHELSYIDHACLDLLASWEKDLRADGGELVLDWDALNGLFRERNRRNGANGEKARKDSSSEEPIADVGLRPAE
ncbi:SulP family inorganic anion transporter [Methylocystis echinoides]|uniref:SulP family inorganic anion transporter n=1 Tax=Methylocystis echinoides TaxID=29468 RepID=UPI003430216F